jgi:hypothetical protein
LRWRGLGVKSLSPIKMRVLSPLLVSVDSFAKKGQTNESIANRGLIKYVMAGCIAVTEIRMLDGNAHSIPAWERARICKCTTCITQLWVRGFTCAQGLLPPVGGAFVRAETNAHVHWVPLDAKPGEQVDSASSPAPRTHEAIRAVGLFLYAWEGWMERWSWDFGVSACESTFCPRDLICGWFENEADWRGGFGCRSESRRNRTNGRGGRGGLGVSALVAFPWTSMPPPPAMKIRGPACFPSGTAGCVVLVTKMPHRRAFDAWQRVSARGRVLATWLILPVVYACLKD